MKSLLITLMFLISTTSFAKITCNYYDGNTSTEDRSLVKSDLDGAKYDFKFFTKDNFVMSGFGEMYKKDIFNIELWKKGDAFQMNQIIYSSKVKVIDANLDLNVYLKKIDTTVHCFKAVLPIN